MMPSAQELRLEVRQLASVYLLIHPEREYLPSDVVRRIAAEIVMERYHSPRKTVNRA